MTIGVKEKVSSPYLVDNKRYICNIEGPANRPLLIFICGIHGNEPMSVLAMNRVLEELQKEKIEIDGNLIAIKGNVKALQLGDRFIDSDLNRLWLESEVKIISNGSFFENERSEMKEIWDILRDKLKSRKQDDCVIFDLHTTSSPSVPFITINDTISNRNIAKNYPVATVFGIEEFLEGPLLSYMNELGFNAIGFEGGQHDEDAALENHKAFIWQSLATQGLISNSLKQVKEAKRCLKKASVDPYKFFEITYRHEVKQEDEFIMYAGYKNFQSIEKNSRLAKSNEIEIVSEWNDRIFMPLYQKKGDDGFFIVRRIPRFFLWLSKVFRSYNFEKLLLLLPGVSIYDEKAHVLAVNNNVASVLRKELFHLFGFRKKIAHSDSVTLFIRREKQ